MTKKLIAPLLILLVAGFFAARWLVQRLSPQPERLGVVDGRFTPCPDSPNCVSTQADPGDAVHYVAPLPLGMSVAEAKVRLANTIADMPRTTIITNTPDYLHAEARSAIWRFVDDVEVFVDEEARQIHFRSASRLGYGDGDVNRRRVEAIQAAFE